MGTVAVRAIILNLTFAVPGSSTMVYFCLREGMLHTEDEETDH